MVYEAELDELLSNYGGHENLRNKCVRGSRKGYEVGAEVQCYYAVAQYDKMDINSPLLKTAPAQVT